MKNLTLKQIKKIFRRVFCGKKFPIKTQLGVNTLHISSRYFRNVKKIKIQKQTITWYVDMENDAISLDDIIIDHVYYIIYTWAIREFDDKFRLGDVPIMSIEKIKFYIDKMLDIIKAAVEDSKWPMVYISNKIISHIKNITVRVDHYKIVDKRVDFVVGQKVTTVTANIFSCLDADNIPILVKRYINMKIYDKEQVRIHDIYLEETSVERWINYEEEEIVTQFVKGKIVDNILELLDDTKYSELWHKINVEIQR